MINYLINFLKIFMLYCLVSILLDYYIMREISSDYNKMYISQLLMGFSFFLVFGFLFKSRNK